MERTYLSYADLAAGGHRGVGHCGEPGPSFWPRGVCLHHRGHFFLPSLPRFAVFVRHKAEGGVEPTGEKVACDFTELPRETV